MSRPTVSEIGGYPVLYVRNDRVYCGLCADDSDEPIIHWEGSPLVCVGCRSGVASAYGEPFGLPTIDGQFSEGFVQRLLDTFPNLILDGPVNGADLVDHICREIREELMRLDQIKDKGDRAVAAQMITGMRRLTDAVNTLAIGLKRSDTTMRDHYLAEIRGIVDALKTTVEKLEDRN